MPAILCSFPQDSHFPIVLDARLPMPPQAPDHPAQRPQPPNWTASVFIIISAKAFSSVGFGLSILAIWFGWALPNGVFPGQPQQRTLAETAEVQPIRKGHRRARSSVHKPRDTSSKPSRRLSAPLPSPPAPIFGVNESTARPDPHRHVYFADSHHPVRRNSEPIETKATEASSIHSPPPNSRLFATEVTRSPVSSTSSLPHNPLPTPPPEDDCHSIRSDTSRISAPTAGRSFTPAFRKFRLSFQSRRKRGQAPDLPTTPELDANADLDSPLETATPSTKRSFTPPWSCGKKSLPSDPVSSLETASIQSSSPKSTSSQGSAATQSFALLPRKPQRRTTTPIPRTLPYEAPYFATPPLLLDDSYSAYLRRLPQFEDDLHPSEGSGESAGSSTRGRDSKGRSSQELPRPSNAEEARSLPKRRSASEDWSPRLGIRT